MSSIGFDERSANEGSEVPLSQEPMPQLDDGGTPTFPDSGSSTPQIPDPNLDEPPLEEPVWEEPVFDNVKISSVIWNGSKYWDRGLYVLSNGRTVFASKGLSKDDVPFDYDEIRSQNGGYYVVGTGDVFVGHTYTRNGGALIIKEGDSFKQQQYAWGNQGPVMSSSRQDVTKQIGDIEMREDSDMDGDGQIGFVEPDEPEVEVQSVVYNDENSVFDRSLYKMTDNTVYFGEQGLIEGDLVMEGEPITKKDGSPIETDGISGMIGMRNGFAIIYYKDGKALQQGFKWGNRGPREFGRLRDVTKQLGNLEERNGVDFDGNNQIGDQMDEDAEVAKVIFNSGRDGFDRSLYEMDNGMSVLAEPGLIPGELPFESDPLRGSDGKPYDASNAVGLMGMRSGFAMIFNEADKYSMQMFKWGGRGVQAKGKKRDITRRIHDTEERADADFTNDGIIGKPHSGKGDPYISRVIFPGTDEYDQGLYQMQDGTLLFAEPDLEKDDTPFEDEVIYGKDGKPLDIPNVVGIYPIRSGFSLVQQDDQGKYIEQGFKYGRKGPQPFGKPRKIKSIDKTEKRIQFDINNDQTIAGQKGGGSDDEFVDGPSMRSINPIDARALIDPLA